MERSFFKTFVKVRAVNQGRGALIREGRNHLKSGSCSMWKSWNWNERIFCQLVSHPQLAIRKGLEGELNPLFSRNNYFCDYHIDSMSYTLVLSRQAGSCMRGGKRENDWDEITTNNYCRQQSSIGSQPQYFCNQVWMSLMGYYYGTYTKKGMWKAVWHGALFQRKNTDSIHNLIAFILLLLLSGLRLPWIKWAKKVEWNNALKQRQMKELGEERVGSSQYQSFNKLKGLSRMSNWSSLSLFGVQFCSYTFFPKATCLRIPRSFIRAEAEQYLILLRRLLLESKRDDSAPTFISSGHNLTFQAQMLHLGFQLQSKSVLCIKGQDRVLDCELQEYKYFLAIGLVLSGVSSKPTIVAPAVSDSDFPISFWITGNTSLCKEHMYLLKYQFVSRCDYLRSVWEPCRDSGLGMN